METKKVGIGSIITIIAIVAIIIIIAIIFISEIMTAVPKEEEQILNKAENAENETKRDMIVESINLEIYAIYAEMLQGTFDEKNINTNISDDIEINYDKKTGIITISGSDNVEGMDYSDIYGTINVNDKKMVTAK